MGRQQVFTVKGMKTGDGGLQASCVPGQEGVYKREKKLEHRILAPRRQLCVLILGRCVLLPVLPAAVICV